MYKPITTTLQIQMFPAVHFDVCPNQIEGSVQDFCTICLNCPVSLSS